MFKFKKPGWKARGGVKSRREREREKRCTLDLMQFGL